jgi:uncharacterized protein YebE (UPF0316 family)
MVLFFIGIIEMLIVTAWTKVVTKTRIFASGVITMINIIIWYYVLQTIIENINNWQLVILYALGCSVGTMIATFYFSLQEKGQAKAT